LRYFSWGTSVLFLFQLTIVIRLVRKFYWLPL
jgi:hypothetical protein